MRRLLIGIMALFTVTSLLFAFPRKVLLEGFTAEW